jgi:hypothetical protein
MVTDEMDELISSGPSSDDANFSETTAISIPTPTALGWLQLVKCEGAGLNRHPRTVEALGQMAAQGDFREKQMQLIKRI